MLLPFHQILTNFEKTTDPAAVQLIIDTEEEYAPMFRAVAKAVKAKVRTKSQSPKASKFNSDEKGLFIEERTAKPGEKPSDFAGIWKDNPRTFKEIRENAWKRGG